MNEHGSTTRRGGNRTAGWLAALTLLLGAAAVAGAAGAGAGANAGGDGLAVLTGALRAPDARGLARESAGDEIGGSAGAADRDVVSGAGGSKVWPLLMSVVVPGAGEIYLGHETRALPLLALDIVGWLGVKKYHDEGHDLRDQYYAYADAHWSEQKLEAAFGVPVDDYSGSYYFPNVSRDPDTGLYRTSLPLWVSAEADRREYYENLGKWDQFIFGWDDFVDPREFMDPDPLQGDITALQDPRASLHRQEYRRLRNLSNDKFTKRDRFLYLNMATRLFSVFQVAWLEGLLGGGPDSPMRVAGHPVRLITEPIGRQTSLFGVSVTY